MEVIIKNNIEISEKKNLESYIIREKNITRKEKEQEDINDAFFLSQKGNSRIDLNNLNELGN